MPTWKKREEDALARIEESGVEYLYSYNPDGRARRHVFAERGVPGGRVVHGVTNLERFAYEVTGGNYAR